MVMKRKSKQLTVLRERNPLAERFLEQVVLKTTLEPNAEI